MSFDSNPDPGRTLGQFGIAVVALVVGAALLFFGIDRFSSDPVASPQPSPSVTESTAPSPTAAPSPSSEPATETPAASEAPTETTTSSEPASEAPTEASETASETASEDPTEEPTDDDRIDPGEISVQVLDAIKDGGDRAREIADEMESDGYRVVAFNPSSIVYETTTVFYTEGYEDEANQVADDYGWDEVVFNDILSETVNVHVVVGIDEQ